MQKIQAMPGITVYVVKSGDTMWDIAKHFYTTVEEICTLNELESDPGNTGNAASAGEKSGRIACFSNVSERNDKFPQQKSSAYVLKKIQKYFTIRKVRDCIQSTKAEGNYAITCTCKNKSWT